MQRRRELLKHHKRLVIAAVVLLAIVLVNLIVFGIGFGSGEIHHCPRHLFKC
jgi:hypothetical protein